MKSPDVLCSKTGRTDIAVHRIETGTSRPARQPLYCLPYAYRDILHEELREGEQRNHQEILKRVGSDNGYCQEQERVSEVVC